MFVCLKHNLLRNSQLWDKDNESMFGSSICKVVKSKNIFCNKVFGINKKWTMAIESYVHVVLQCVVQKYHQIVHDDDILKKELS